MMSFEPTDFVVVAAINDIAIFESCLKRSPDIVSGRLGLIEIHNAESMSKAYNAAMETSGCAVFLFAHQDVYLPEGWLDKAIDVLGDLVMRDPDWAVAGPYGVKDGGQHIGRVWDTTLGTELCTEDFDPAPVGSLDELLLIVRNAGGLRFDPDLPHFHLYGTDIVQTAREKGYGAYAVELPVVHNTRPTASLRGGYLKAYKFARRKWRHKLPIWTTISAITYNPFALWRRQWSTRKVAKRPPMPERDAKEVARRLGYE